jgi:protease I
MKTYLLIAALFLAGSAAAFAQHAPGKGTDAEKTAVMAALQYYIDGSARRDTATLHKGFHPSAELRFINAQGDFQEIPLDTWLRSIGAATGLVAERKSKVLYIDVSENAAQAKLEIELPTNWFYDYMNLLKVNGEWKIVSKIFYSKPKMK